MPTPRLIRHQFIDRLLHWLMAAAVLVLLATALPPQFGVDFSWVHIHWIAGIVLSLLLLGHVLRRLSRRSLRRMVVGRADFAPGKPGKYSLAQKSMHHLVALITLTALVTGFLLLVRIDSPFWERNPYWLEAATWGYIYVLHGLAALFFVSVIMLHVYFALRPEKRLYLRSMLGANIDREQYFALHEDEAGSEPTITSKGAP